MFSYQVLLKVGGIPFRNVQYNYISLVTGKAPDLFRSTSKWGKIQMLCKRTLQ